MTAILQDAEEPYCRLYVLLAGCAPMRAGEALGLDIRSIHEDFRTLEFVQKAKRGDLQDHMKNVERGFQARASGGSVRAPDGDVA